MRRIAILPALFCVLVASNAFAGRVQDYVDARGACSSPASLYVFGELHGRPRTIMGLAADEWTDNDIAELRKVYRECLRRWPVGEVPGDFSTDGQFVPKSGAVERKVDVEVNALIQFNVGPARAEKNAEEVAANAKRRLEKARSEAAERARGMDVERAREAAEAAAISAREQATARREAMRKQAEEDRVAADRAQKLATEEEADLAATQKDADAAHDARIQAEERLALARQSVANLQQRRAAEDRQAEVAGQEQRRTEQREQERKADEALAKTCAVSADQFKRVSLGMTLHQARETFGCLGSLTSSTDIAGAGTITTYQWDGAAGGVSVTVFSNGRMVSKSQSALD